MSFKPDTFQPIALTGFGVLSAHGADAEAFLQAQSMNDVRALAPGRWQWNGWLTPKGRVVALFALLRTGADRFLLVLPDHPADTLRAELQRFVFRSRVKLTADDTWVVAQGSAATGAEGTSAAGDDAAGWALDFGGEGGPRTLRLLPRGIAVAHPTPAAAAAWRAADIAHGLPRLGTAQKEAWTPQMLSLERLGAFSLKKGCYPGQEIVARTHYLGQAKRGLVRVGGGPMREGDAVLDGERTVGTVVCTTATADEALAVLSADAGEELAVDGRRVVRLRMNGGLDRST